MADFFHTLMNSPLKQAFHATALLTVVALSPALHAATDTDHDGIPDSAETFLGTDPLNADTDGDGLNDLKDKSPLSLTNPIVQTGNHAPFRIKHAQVEDNYNYTLKKDATDHLELLVENMSDSPLRNFSIYYTITDVNNGKKESYFKVLKNFDIAPKAEARLHFDQGVAPRHFRANPNSIYKTSSSAKIFNVELAIKGYKPVKVVINKDKGGAETAD